MLQRVGKWVGDLEFAKAELDSQYESDYLSWAVTAPDENRIVEMVQSERTTRMGNLMTKVERFMESFSKVLSEADLAGDPAIVAAMNKGPVGKARLALSVAQCLNVIYVTSKTCATGKTKDLVKNVRGLCARVGTLESLPAALLFRLGQIPWVFNFQ